MDPSRVHGYFRVILFFAFVAGPIIVLIHQKHGLQQKVSEGRVTRVIPGDSAISLISGGFLVLKAVDITDIARKTGDSGDILTSKSQKIFAQLRCG